MNAKNGIKKMSGAVFKKSHTGYLEQTEHRLKSSRKAIFKKEKAASKTTPESEEAAIKIFMEFCSSTKKYAP